MIMNKMEEEPELEPPRQIHNSEHLISINIINFQDLSGMISTDQTGRFPTTSGQGNTCITIMYDHDSNLINAAAIKSRLEKDLVNGYKKLYEDLQKAGIKPLIQQLNNEVSKELIKAIEDKNQETTKHYQLREQYKHLKIISLRDYTTQTIDFQAINGTN